MSTSLSNEDINQLQRIQEEVNKSQLQRIQEEVNELQKKVKDHHVDIRSLSLNNMINNEKSHYRNITFPSDASKLVMYQNMEHALSLHELLDRQERKVKERKEDDFDFVCQVFITAMIVNKIPNQILRLDPRPYTVFHGYGELMDLLILPLQKTFPEDTFTLEVGESGTTLDIVMKRKEGWTLENEFVLEKK